MKIKSLISVLSILFAFSIQAQVGIGTETPNASSLLDLSSTSKGFLVPRMTEAQKNAISSPAQGLLIYQTDGTIGFYNHDGSNWSPLSQSSLSTPTFLYGTENVLLDGTTSPNVGDMHRSVGLGYLTLNSVTSGNKNVAIGSNAMRRNTTGSKNVGIGWTALNQNTSGSRNVAIGGSEALDANTTGSDNVAIGDRAMTYNTTGQANIAIGYLSLGNNDGGNYNTMIGYGSGSNIRTENGNTGNNNVGMGYRALELNYSGDDNVAIGWDALRRTKGSGNLGVGYKAGWYNVDGSNNTFIGKQAGIGSSNATNLTNATALGYNAIVNASNKIRLGDTNVTNIETSATFTAGAVTYPNTDGSNGQVLKTNGSGSLSWTTVSSGATNINGLADAVVSNQETIIIGSTPNVGTEARYSTGVGKRVLERITTGDENIAMGHQALGETTTGSYNTAIGSHVNFRNTTGNSNSSFGVRVLENNTTGSNNTGIGANAGDTNTTGSNNTFIGRGSDANANNLSNATALGYNAIVNASNKIQLGDSNVTLVETSGTVYASAFVGDGSGLTNLPASTIQAPIEAYSITLNSTHHGRIFYSQHSNRPQFPNPDTLPAGFECTIVNYSGYEGSLTSPTSTFIGVRSPNLYPTRNHEGIGDDKIVSINNNLGVGSKAFPVNKIGFMSGGTIRVIVIPISGSNFYYVSGDYYYPNN